MKKWAQREPIPDLISVKPKKFEMELKLKEDLHLALELTNTTRKTVAFKVKTTAPDRYLVRPTQSTIPGGDTKICKLVLSKMSDYPEAPKGYLRDKFLIQSVTVDEKLVESDHELADLWKEIESQHNPKELKHAYNGQQVTCKLFLPGAVIPPENGGSNIQPQVYGQEVERPPTNKEPEERQILESEYQKLLERSKEYDSLLNRAAKFSFENTALKEKIAELKERGDTLDQEKQELQRKLQQAHQQLEEGLRKRTVEQSQPASLTLGPSRGIETAPSAPTQTRPRSLMELSKDFDKDRADDDHSVFALRGIWQLLLFAIVCFTLGRLISFG
jgi:hypothetical protein